jgi:hypothetical protein
MRLAGTSRRFRCATSWRGGVLGLALVALLFLSARPICEALRIGVLLPQATHAAPAPSASPVDHSRGEDGDGLCCAKLTAGATAIAADPEALVPFGGKVVPLLVLSLLLFASALPRAAVIAARSDPPQRRYHARSARNLR